LLVEKCVQSIKDTYMKLLVLLYTEVIPLIVEQEYLSIYNFKHKRENKKKKIIIR
jgi:hypothetical protein